MNRIAAFLAAVLLLASSALAEMPDFKSMTQAEIMDIINAGRNALYTGYHIRSELARRKTDDGITIIITDVTQGAGDPRYIFINWTVINDSDSDYNVTADAIFVNGWKVFDSVFYTIEARRREKNNFWFSLSDADLSSATDIEDIEIRLSICPVNSRDEIQLDTIYIKRGQ